jgi:NADH oxidase (H2O2-forming)
MKKGRTFVIIGNGIAGITAAHTIRTLRAEAVITIISQEAHPAYSACVLPDYVAGGIERKRVFIRSFAHYRKDRIRFIAKQKVQSLDTDRKEITSSSGRLSYDTLIVATGSRVALPLIAGLEKRGVFAFKSLDDAEKISRWPGRRAVVVGSGAVGVEVSIALKRKGYSVCLLELTRSILPSTFDAVFADPIKDILERHGIAVFTGEKVLEILGNANVRAVVTGRREIPCDTVIMASGMKPDVEIAEAKIALGQQGGIRVDDAMRTSASNIYACGDCVEAEDLVGGGSGLSMLWQNAWQQGEIAGSNAAGLRKTYPGWINASSLDLFGVQAVSIGYRSNAVAGDLELIDREKSGRHQRLILQDGVLVGVQSINWSENNGALLSAIIRREKLTAESARNWDRPFRASASHLLWCGFKRSPFSGALW